MKPPKPFPHAGGSLLACFFAFLLIINFQPAQSQEDTLIQDESIIWMDGKKSAQGVSFTWSSNDAEIRLVWSGIKNPCTIPTSTTVKVYRYDTHTGTQVELASKGASGSHTMKVGPAYNQNYRYYYRIRAYYSGIFCSGYSGYYGLYAYSKNLYPPKNVDATYDKFDDKIVIGWDPCGTHLEANEYKYRVKRMDGSVVQENISSSTTTSTDTRPARGVEEKYYVETYSPTYGNKRSATDSDVGRKFDLNVRTVNKDDGVKIEWTKADVMNPNPIRFIIERRAEGETPVNLKTIIGATSVAAEDISTSEEAPYPGYKYMYIVTPENDTKTFRADSALGCKNPNGEISGVVDTRSGGNVAGVTITAERIDTIPQGTVTQYQAVTNSQGEYLIEGIYYYTEARFKVTPVLDDHEFDPPADTVKLKVQAQGNKAVANFKDESSFSVIGRVYQVFAGDTCPVEDVEILIDGIPKDYRTDATGIYNLTVPTTATYVLKPELFDHLFHKEDTTIFINDDLEGLDFLDTTMYSLNGKVAGPCDIYIGQAELQIKSVTSECIDTTILSDTTGNFQITLPARKYTIRLVAFHPEDPDDVKEEEVKFYFYGADTLDLRKEDQERDYIFRRDPVLEVSSFDEWGCGNYSVPIIELGQSETILIKVKEIFGDDWCYADTGYIIVKDGTVDEGPKIDTIWLVEGKAEYRIVPGYPNFVSPHLKSFEITAHVEGASDKFTQDILVTGNEPRTSNFATVTPELPFMILRDPPGDGSRSYLEKSTTSKYSMSLALERSASVNAWGEVKVGCEYEAGQFIFTTFKAWGSVKASLEVGASLKNSQELELSITNGSEFSTSGDPAVTGESGDVYAGAAMNIQYALTDILEYDPEKCTVVQDVDIIMGVTGFETTFIYTENHITEVLLPQLARIRDIHKKQGSDSVVYYANQIKAWQDILDMNDELKEKAVPNPNPSPDKPGNISFSAHSPTGYFTEISKTRTHTVEFSLFLDAALAIEAGVEIGGVGFSGGIEVKTRMELGGSRSVGVETVQKTGFELNDDDLGDAFTVDILEDKVYGTPVFKLVSGQSSCPWEPGTLPREELVLTADTYERFVENPDDPAVFTLKMANTSESDEDRTYNLVFLQESNPDGAKLTLGGSEVQGGIPTPYEIPAGKFINATVTVSRGITAYDYNDLRFKLESPCDGNISDEVALTVNFKSPCSSIKLGQPKSGWVVSAADDDTLDMLVTGYDTAWLEAAEVQYAEAGTNAWTTLAYYDKTQLEETSTPLKWELDYMDDGKYDIRTMVKCATSFGYSDVITGIIDRRAPEVFGTPEPADGVISKGDLISVKFDEPIKCENISVKNVKMINTGTDEVIPVQVGCYGDEIIVLPNTVGITVNNSTFRVIVTGVEDLYGNASDTVSWYMDAESSDDFEVGLNEDTDLDGVLNKSDNCIIAYNPGQEDMDNDNEGDQCDDDIDGDNVLNVEDNCSMTANPGQEDSDENGIGDACDVTGIAPIRVSKYHLYNNYPNPFAEFTNIEYRVGKPSHVTLKVYNILGEVLEILLDENSLEGKHSVRWETAGYGEGIYFYSIEVRDGGGNHLFSDFKKMILVR